MRLLIRPQTPPNRKVGLLDRFEGTSPVILPRDTPTVLEPAGGTPTDPAAHRKCLGGVRNQTTTRLNRLYGMARTHLNRGDH
jgi:hypothetical protein